MADFLTDLGNFLVDGGFKTAINTDVFLDTVPDNPSELIALLEYDSSRYRRIEKTMDRKVQINVLGKNIYNTKMEIHAIYNLLTNHIVDEGIYVLNSGRIFIFNPLGTPFKLKMDENQRVVYVLNVLITTNKDN